METSAITRLAFLKQISDNDIVDIMCNYFDQNMALYSLISDRINDLIIHKNIDHENGIITFNITINNVDTDISSLTNLNNQYIEYYGRLFSIVLNRTANGLDISFKEEVVV